MITFEHESTSPKAFISYSWDDDTHREWVKQLAIRLIGDGVDVTLDYWHAEIGDPIPEFMERAIRESKFLISICTPRYREKSDKRDGGVGYEVDIMTAYFYCPARLSGPNRYCIVDFPEGFTGIGGRSWNGDTSFDSNGCWPTPRSRPS